MVLLALAVPPNHAGEAIARAVPTLHTTAKMSKKFAHRTFAISFIIISCTGIKWPLESADETTTKVATNQ